MVKFAKNSLRPGLAHYRASAMHGRDSSKVLINVSINLCSCQESMSGTDFSFA